ncbi:hypothetical protein [Alkalithermobacter paradoxus]|uniref:Uncharacterized protein n=1 Tax=Alkalithermobacter paradoxus TaxID=29349 RepID=A0A1V4I7S9_9FIRM|nr:hypothetical protein CLOTH_11320 [[Clostridium] thermoalcaliphilum]
MKAKNPNDSIQATYNAEKYKVIERPLTGLVMPLDMKRDFDCIDSVRFSEGESLVEDDKK